MGGASGEPAMQWYGAQFVVVFCCLFKWLVVGGKEAVSQGFSLKE